VSADRRSPVFPCGGQEFFGWSASVHDDGVQRGCEPLLSLVRGVGR
jgi:hypothetical protein